MSWQSRVNALFFNASKFSVDDALAWARKHGLQATRDRVKKRSGRIVIHTGGEMRDEHEYRTVNLSQGVKARIEIVGGGAVGKYRDAPNTTFYVPPQGGGGSPTHNVAPLPDFNEIFNHKVDDPEQKKREQEQASIRRRQLASHSKEKFGFHGVAAPEPVLAYEPEHYPLVVRGSSGQNRDREDGNPNEKPQPRAPRFVVSGTHRRNAERETANGPVPTKRMR